MSPTEASGLPLPRGAEPSFLSTVRGDLSGALSAAFITLPQCVGYGLLAFAPLGLEFAPQAALLGVYSAVFGGFVSALRGGTPVQISGPKAPLTLVVASVVAALVVSPHIHADGAHRVTAVVALASLCVLVGGLVQLSLGALRLGNMVKYVPFPVVAGFLNGIGWILVASQLRPLAGVARDVPFPELLFRPAAIQPLTLLVGCATVAALFGSKRFVPRVPASLVGLAAGTALYYVLRVLAGPSELGPTIDAIPFEWPWPRLADLLALAPQVEFGRILPSLLVSGVFLGLIGALESLLGATAIDNVTGARHDSNRELLGQGLGNVCCALFGALPSAGSVPRSLANYRAGGRTRLSGVLSSLLLLGVVLALGSLVGRVPAAVIAGLITAVGIGMFDPWTLDLARRLKLPFRGQRELLLDFGVALVVAILTVTVSLTVAVGLGVAIATGLFVSKMGRSVIRRRYTGREVRSRNTRSLEAIGLLEERGEQVAVFELQGPIFFGSAENLAQALCDSDSPSRYCILDMKRVTEIDSTGANILLRTGASLRREGKYLAVSHLTEESPLRRHLEAMGAVRELGAERFFSDTDAALEWAEDQVLASSDLRPKGRAEKRLEQMEVLQGCTPEEAGALEGLLRRRDCRKGEPVFREGEGSTSLFFLVRGSVSIRAKLPESRRVKRLITYQQGVIFGELAFLDGRRRSADVWADEEVTVFELTPERFERLRRERPEIALKLLWNVSRELSSRLRLTSREVQVIEDA